MLVPVGNSVIPLAENQREDEFIFTLGLHDLFRLLFQPNSIESHVEYYPNFRKKRNFYRKITSLNLGWPQPPDVGMAL